MPLTIGPGWTLGPGWAGGGDAGPAPVVSTDPYFMYNSLLLTGDGTNLSQNNTFLDSSTNNFAITRAGNTTQGTFSPYGANWSNYFDGAGDSLQAPSGSSISGTGDFTAECWIYPTAVPGTYNVIGCSDTSGGLTMFGLNANGTIFMGRSLIDVQATTTNSLSYNTWNHIAVSRSSGTVRLFINGVQGYSGSITTNYNAGVVRLGTDGGGSALPYTGYVSNFRIIPGTALYTGTFTPPTALLTAVAGTSLLTSQSNRFIDNSTNAFAITVNGNTNIQRFSPFEPSAAYSTSTIGGSGYFDGTTSNIITTNTITTVGTQDFCLEAWVYCLSTTSYACIIGNDSPGGAVAFFIEMGTARGIFLGGPEVSLGSAQYNRWVHIVFCRVSGTYGGFVNGTRIATGAFTGNMTTPIKIGINNYVGGSSSGFGTTGYISDGRVTVGSSPYSPSSTTITVPTAPLTAVSNTVFLANMTNAGITDSAMINDLQTVGDAKISTTQSKFGGSSMSFDGTGDYLVSSPKNTLALGDGNFTIEMWIYPSNVSTSEAWLIAQTDYASNTGWSVFLNNNTVKFRLGNTGGTIQSSASVVASAWQHLALSRVGTTLTMYLNGTSIGSGTVNNFTDANLASVVGGITTTTGWNNNLPYTGYIDDLRVTKGVARYTANFTPPTAALPTY